MSQLTIYILRKIFSKIFTQSHNHTGNLITVYILIREALTDEFQEDSPPTLDIFAREAFEKALRTHGGC